MIQRVDAIRGYLPAFLGREIIIPEPPQIKEEQLKKLNSLNFEPLFLPRVDPRGSYIGWQKPLPENYWKTEIIQRIELPGCWIWIESQPKPEYLCRVEDNMLTCLLGLSTRFDYGWRTVMEKFIPQIAEILGFPIQAVRLPSAVEWNFMANFFLFLAEKGLPYSDWGSTRSWEWCLNKYGREHALIVGSSDFGGTSALGWKYFGERSWFGAMLWWRPIIILSGGEESA